ncbi:hypothetical protein HanXRQr2_Chr07g0305701 [Helianthus annuus]|uniref:Uncharacterized protein n=1 Tax=Helianthus annuus TaxID=4232 RepID=A0A9K3IN57_HELAN|nr:hypothetical protein HanXRQr2_Chr07g0305701 [Helianthus annuus]KAJ0959128.1 hypothetical protein HanPSC8_Chr00c468g0808691 [Helianthus annuus]
MVRVVLSFYTNLTPKLTSIHVRDHPSNKLSNYREHTCNFIKLGTKGETLTNHRDYPCILLFSFSFLEHFLLFY